MVWLTNWNYRKVITISNAGSTLSDYQVLITIDTASLVTVGKMRSDCGDIRFTTSDGSTLIYYWIESGCNISSTKIWVKIPSILTGTTTIYLYYGNPSAVSASNGVNVFLNNADVGFDTTTGWITTGAVSVNTALKRMDYNYSSNKGSGYADAGAGYLPNDWIFEFEWNVTWPTAAGEWIGIAGYTNQISWNTPSSVYLLNYNGDGEGLYVVGTGGWNYHEVPGLIPANYYYGRIQKVGNDFTATLYTNAARTTVGYTKSYTRSDVTNLRYIMLSNQYNNWNVTGSGYVKNAYVRKYTATEPTVTLGSEQTPSNITATSMTITQSETPCRVGICTVSVDVTWTNTGGIAGTFTPSITVDGTPVVVTPPLTPVTLNPYQNAGDTVIRTFSISNMTAAAHTICPNPN